MKMNLRPRPISKPDASGLYLPFCLAQTTAQMYPRVGILPQITSFFNTVLGSFFAGDLLLRIRGKADDRYRYALVIGYGIFYTFLICTTDSPIAFTYILPVVSLLVLYKDQKFMVGCAIANIASVIVSVFIIWSFSVRILQRTRKIISCRLPVSCSVISAISCLSATSSNPTVP